MFVEPEVAAREAERGLHHIDMKDDPGMASARVAGHAGRPLLVTRMDLPGQKYYLVPWENEQGVAIIIQVDASTGKLASVANFPAPLQRIVMSPDEASQAAVNQSHQNVIGEPQLVWQPCHESASPLQPLYRISLEQGHVYVDVSGRVYRNLTTFGRGG